jgi:hypothetical protein
MTDQLHQPIMTDQHRATPLQWRLVEEDDAQAPSCILELRSRIEALEATQHVHADVLRLSDAERERLTQELAKLAAVRPLETETTYGSEAAADAVQILRAPMVVEGTFDHGGETYRLKANATPERDPATTEHRPGGLVERVTSVLGHYGDGTARAAIREVAKWLRAGRMLHAAELLEQETDR